MAFTYKHGDQPLEGYTIQRGVGRGGFGEVYYAVSEGGKEVALKYLRDNPMVELRGVSHCINLKSPHLVTIFDVKPNADGEYFIIMEYVSGPSLRDLLIAEPEGLGLQKAAFFAREIGKGLSYLHDRGIVHRDLKPGNIFYEDGYVKIGDYGLAKAISVSRHSGQTASVGTVHYMAPEVGTGNYHRGIDIYALGVMLYEMLLGKVPFEGSTMGEVLMKHLTQQPEVDALQAPFASVIRKALAKDPQDRYQTIDEMISEMFTESEVEKSVASFKPESIRMVARHAMETQIGNSPVHSPARAQHAPPPPPPPLHGFERSAQVARNAAQVAVDFARQQHQQNVHGAPAGGAMPAMAQEKQQSGFWGRALLAMLVIGGLLGLAAGLFSSDAELVVPAFGYVVALSLGATIGYRVLNRMPTPEHPGWASRLVTLGCSAVPIAIVGAFTTMLGFPREMVLAALAMSLLVDWTKRVHHGQQGRLLKGEALTAGIWGAVIAAPISDGNEHVVFIMMAVGAATSLAVQAGSWLFRRHGERPMSGSGAGSDWTYLEQKFDAPAQKGHMLRIAQYFESLGYSIEEKSRRSLKATRGSKAATILAGDIRTYRTELWVRAEDLGRHQLRYACQYKIWTDRDALGDDQIAVLDGEVTQLSRRMNGGGVETAFGRAPRVDGGEPRFPVDDPGARARAAVISTPFDGRPSVGRSSPNWPPPPPARGAASPPERKLRSTFGRVFWSFATAACLSAGVGLTAMAIVTIERQEAETRAYVSDLAKYLKVDSGATVNASNVPGLPKAISRSSRKIGPIEFKEKDDKLVVSFPPGDFSYSNRWSLKAQTSSMIKELREARSEEIPLVFTKNDIENRFVRQYGYDEAIGPLSGGLACLAMAIFCFCKTTRYKRIGFWRETLKPLLLCICLAGVGSIGAVAGTLPANDVPKAVFAIPIAFCAISFVLLLLIRGRTEHAPERAFAA